MLKVTSGLIIAIAITGVSFPSGAALADAPAVFLSIPEPVRHGRRGGLVEGRDWTLEFRLTVPNAVGFVEQIGNTSRREALIISDDDNCIEVDLGHPVYSPGPFEPGCANGDLDDVFFAFRSDPNDRTGVRDGDACDDPDNIVQAPRLNDDPFDPTAPAASNKAYLELPDQFNAPPSLGFPPPPSVQPVGALTGGDSSDDCHGYGRDEDLPGLVVMADVGAARVFDENFNLVEVQPGVRRIRNLAGFMSMVTKETVDRFNRSHVVGHMQIERGMLEPLVGFDTRTLPFFPYTNTTFARRIDGGPVEEFAWNVLPAANPSQTELAIEVQELLATLPDVTSVRVRAVLVEGEAPDFIDDLDGNGRFNAADVVAMGYTLLSNQAIQTVNVVQQEKLSDFGGTNECPSRQTIVGIDTDGNGVGFFCQDGDGSSRAVKRIP